MFMLSVVVDGGVCLVAAGRLFLFHVVGCCVLLCVLFVVC